MAEKKKVYSIVINGLKESVDAVDSLNRQLDTLKSNIDALSKSKINIKVEGNVEEVKTPKVSGNTATTVDKEKELAIQKQITAEIKAQGQYQAALTQEYQDAHKVVQQTKQDTKDMLSGAIDQAGQYTNTMAGWKAELRDLTSERNRLNLTKPEDLERFREIQERANALTTILKTIEQETGNFKRNVGNYPQLVSSLNTELENTERTIKTISDEMGSTAAGSDRYNKLASELEIAQKHADDLRKKIGEVGQQIQSTPKFEIKVGDTVRQFDTLKQASKELLNEYTKLVAEGKQDTKEANDLAEAYGRVATSMKNARGELSSYIGGAKGMADAIEIMQGVSSIASIGAGLQGLFGGNEALNESLQKFASITMIMQGLNQLQKSMADKTSMWGVILATVWDTLDKVFNKLGDITGISGQIEKRFKTWSVEGFNIGDALNKNIDSFEKLISTTEKEKSAVADIAKELLNAEENATTFKSKMAASPALANDPTMQTALNMETGKIDEARKKLTELAKEGNNAAKTFLELDDAIQDGAAKAVDYFARTGKNAVDEMKDMSKTSVAVARGVNFITTAFKGLAKATVILAAIQLAMEAITWAIDKVSDGLKYLGSYISSWFGSVGAIAGQTQASVDSLSASIDQVSDSLSDYNKEVDRMKNAGAINSLDAMGLKMERLKEEISQAGKETQNFIGTVDNLNKALKNNLGAIGAWYEGGEKSVDDFMKRWETLKKAVEAGTDELKQETGEGSFWYTASDAVDDFTDANKAMLQDLANQINAIDFSKPEKAVEQFDNLFKGRLGNMRDYAVRNIDKLFPDEPWAQMLNARLEQMKSFVDSYKELLGQTADDSAALLKQAEKIIRDNTTAALPKNQREAQQSKNARADEIAEARKAGYDTETQRRVIESINKKYDRQDRERRQSHGASVSNIEKQIRDNNLAAERDGLQKRLQQLKNSMADELLAAQKGGVRVAELQTSIRRKYNALMLKEQKEWYKRMQDIQEKFNQTMLDNERVTWNELIKVRDEMRVNMNAHASQNLETQNMKQTASVSYDFSMEGTQEGVEKAKEYYDKLLELERNYIQDKKDLDKEAVIIQADNDTRQLEADYKEETITIERWKKEQLQIQKDYYEQGLIEEAKYQENIQSIILAAGEKGATAYSNYEGRKADIVRQKEADIARIEQESLESRQEANKKATDGVIQEIQTMYDTIGEKADEFDKQKTTVFGFLKIKQLKQQLKEAEQGYQQTLQNIEKQYADLQTKLDNEEINFNQFKQAKQELKKLEKATKDSLKNTQNDLKNFSQTVAQNIADTVTMYMSQLYEVFQMFDDIMQQKYDNEQSELDHQQEMLDQENENLENYYQKAQEITQKYTDNINGIEDELKNARGERRQFLIDQLAQQKEAQLGALENENEIQRQKEANEKKQEALKKKQDELDRKRRKQQKLANIASAVMSTAVAVTNALALQPFWVGIAMAAVAAAMGAVQIATISAQKIYAKGGVIDGPSHKQGGVKIKTKDGVSEVEGKEFITNKETTQKNLPLMYYINSQKKHLTKDDLDSFFDGKTRKISPKAGQMKFADGGQMPEMQDFDLKKMIPQQQEEEPKTYQVQVVDIINAIDNVETVKTLAGA